MNATSRSGSCGCSRPVDRPVGACRPRGRTIEIAEAVPEAFDGVDIALFSAGADISRELAPAAAARGATVIDNSSAWRMEPDIPLVVSQVNPHDLEGHQGIIANPNCSTMQLAPVLMALRDSVGLERVVVDTYQSVSGTGADAIAEMEGQIRAHVNGEAKVATVYPHPIAFNALPEIDVFLPNGYTKEEWKVVSEDRKILGLPDLRISCTAVRIPVFVSHSEAVHVETRDPLTPARARELFAAVQGVIVQDDPATHDYPLATTATGRDEIFVGRVRQDVSIAGRSRHRVLGRLGQPAQGRGDECRRDRRGPRGARLGAQRLGPRRASVPCRGATRGGHGVIDAERRTALEVIAAEVRDCTRCRLHETRRKAVPGEGDPDTEVVFVGEGPGQNEDREGRPFIGRAGDLLVKLLGSLGWRRTDVFITNVVKCRPPDNRDPLPDEIAACSPYLTRQLEILDPAVVVTLGRFSMARFLPGAKISQVHGTIRPADPETGARNALVLAMYHPAAALRTAAIERESFDDIAGLPGALIASRKRREEPSPAGRRGRGARPTPPSEPATSTSADTAPSPSAMLPANTGDAADTDQLTLF